MMDTPPRKLDLGTQWRPESHRSGWPYALDSLSELHTPGGVVLEGFIEKKFAWGGDRGDRWNGPRPHTRPWVGFWHNPPTVHPSFNRATHAPADILAGELWQQSAPYCRGLFTLSHHLRRWLQPRVGVPVTSLLHPTGPPTAIFSPRRYAANPHKRIVQVGWWLRRMEALAELYVPALEKTVLNPFPHGWADYGKARGVSLLDYLDDRGYDELLAENIVFLDLYDSSANNAIIECIVRLTPILINPLPAVVEYLGEGYPLYFNDPDEAARKAQNIQLVIAAHQYLRDVRIRPRLTGEHFMRSLAGSAIYQSLPSAQPSARTSHPRPRLAPSHSLGYEYA